MTITPEDGPPIEIVCFTDVKQVFEALYNLLAACDDIEQSLAPYIHKDTSPEKTYSVSRAAITRMRDTVENIRSNE